MNVISFLSYEITGSFVFHEITKIFFFFVIPLIQPNLNMTSK